MAEIISLLKHLLPLAVIIVLVSLFFFIVFMTRKAFIPAMGK